MTDFALGVLSSLAATVLTVVGGWFGTRHARQWQIAWLSRMTGIGIVRMYPRQREAGSDLAADLAEATEVTVLTGRGNELARETFQGLWSGTNRKLRTVRVLLPDTVAGHDAWLVAREAELLAFDPGTSPGLLSKQILANTEYIANLAARDPRIGLRLYDLPTLSRVVLTDKVAYLTLYAADEHGHSSPCLVVRSGSSLYDFAVRMVTTAWAGGRDPGTSPQNP